eukprot:Em0006g1086a
MIKIVCMLVQEKPMLRSSHCTPTGQELWLKRQLDEDVLKPCDREISEEVTKDKENDDEGNKEEGEEKQEQDDETEKDDEEKGEDEEEKEDENEENEEEDEEREEEDEEIAKDSGDVDKDDDEEEDEDDVVEKEMEGTYVGTVASELESTIEESHKTTSASDLPVYQYSADSEKCDDHESDHDENAEAGATFGAVLEATESRKHQANDEKCSALGWVSTPLAVDSYGAWGKEASLFLAQVAARLAIHKSLPKSQASFDLFSNLSICLIRANARAILRRV